MHILIDVRTTSPSDTPFLHYAQLWAELWKDYHPHDEVTFLGFVGDDVDHFPVIHIPRGWDFFPKKITNHVYGPHRVVSFSRLPPYDTSIPHILHVSDLSPLLYPDHVLSYFEQKYLSHKYNKLFSDARHIIIPHLDIGRTVSELFHVDEEKMSVIPYLSPINGELMSHRTILPHGIYEDYFITEGTPSNEWRPIGLLEAYSHYIHRLGGTEKLVIHGFLGENIATLTAIIRTLDLSDHIVLTGVLTRDEREVLYSHALGWIYAGISYSRGPSITLANGYHIPLIFPDIPGLRDYEGRCFHPNHIDILPEIMKKPKGVKGDAKYPNNEVIMGVYTRLLAL